MNRHQCILCLGSNWNAEENIDSAIKELTSIFSGIQFSKPVKTSPIGMPNDYMFVNCTAKFTTCKSQDEIRDILKTIERRCGRNREDKKRGIIHLDVDLLKIDGIVLKPDDMRRDFVIKGLSAFQDK